MEEVGANVVESEKEGTDKLSEHVRKTLNVPGCYSVNIKFRVWSFEFQILFRVVAQPSNSKLTRNSKHKPETVTVLLLT